MQIIASLPKDACFPQLQRFRQQLSPLPEYDSIMRECFREHPAERVTLTIQASQKVYFLPRNAVIRRDTRIAKLRVAFDTLFHVPDQHPLNDILEKGPRLDADILKLVTFRSQELLLTADIRKA